MQAISSVYPLTKEGKRGLNFSQFLVAKRLLATDVSLSLYLFSWISVNPQHSMTNEMIKISRLSSISEGIIYCPVERSLLASGELGYKEGLCNDSIFVRCWNKLIKVPTHWDWQSAFISANLPTLREFKLDAIMACVFNYGVLFSMGEGKWVTIERGEVG